MQFKLVMALVAGICGTILTSPSFGDWVPSSLSGSPPASIVGGIDQNGNALYICRGYVGTSAQPGWRQVGTTQCHFGYAGAEYVVGTYDSWIPAWTATSYSNLPKNALPFGYEQSPTLFEPRYPCEFEFGGSVVPGKFGTDLGGCYIPYGGHEVHWNQFDGNFGVLTDEFGLGQASFNGEYTFTNGSSLGPYQVRTTSLSNIPFDAIVGGYEANGQYLYLCDANYAGGIHPGKTRPGFNACDISYGGSEVYISNYRVLVPNWISFSGAVSSICGYCSGTPIPISTGYDTDGTPLYICRVEYNGAWIPGKIRTNGNACDIGVGSRELFPSANYELLINGYR